MTIITALCIPADSDAPLRLVAVPAENLQSFQDLVGGNIEPVELYRPNGTMYLNEEGKIQGLRPNPRATVLASVHNRFFRGQDFVAGDAMVVGPLNGLSLDTTIPARYVELWTEAKAFRVQKKRAGAKRWNGSRRTFDDVLIAYVYAKRLAQREPDVEDVRVVPFRVPEPAPVSPPAPLS
ncbi:DUF3846 domain-containing protein [Frankia sp. AgB1.9]|uniref:DUF3846 domain-containing protein n=1 Tax=unclassified Frankia TaxID=2632575 RepID=UPI001932A4CD|nr:MULTISPECIES: DUF3846 domain-containing protein [unclassified Frankia]MBL7486778.1 DUF3846 domain-containing protein [Frankia sp. AgW1.1]MBL7547912.1 DUF3846 domain-containing protein [Frankia sp. AgB1.9]MBL7623963.1 DUF3846 domain-containing protein [Frankia sp. AgB1.8]